MQKSNKLVFSWLAYLLILSSLIVTTKIYHCIKQESASIYQYRILIDKNFYKTELITEKKESTESLDPSEFVKEKSVDDQQEELYEHVKHGDIPKISSGGARVLDVYSAKFSATDKKKACLALFIDKISLSNFSDIVQKLVDIKVTFILPYYLEKLHDIVDIIVNSGHEFFLQIPTQTAIPNDRKATVSPFFANTDQESLVDNLSYLLSSTKYAIGIANTTSTLLTKSLKDMKVISEELSKRGVAFLDCEKSSEVSKTLSENPSFAQINASENFILKPDINLGEMYDGKVFSIRIEKLNDFLNAVAKYPEYVVAPISSLFKKNNG